jgi:hypothetical protein
MITTRAVPAPLPAHNRRVATSPSVMKDFADPLPGGVARLTLGCRLWVSQPVLSSGAMRAIAIAGL